MSSDEWRKKVDRHTHTHAVEYQLALKKEGNPAICNSMGVSQTQKDK